MKKSISFYGGISDVVLCGWLYADTEDNQLEIVVEDENGKYQKHIVGLSDNVTYTLEQKQYEDVSNYRYTLNFNPDMWFPVDVKTIE